MEQIEQETERKPRVAHVLLGGGVKADIELPKGVGLVRFRQMCNTSGLWLRDTDGWQVRATSIKAFVVD